MIENKEELKEFIKETVREILIEERLLNEATVYVDKSNRKYRIGVHPDMGNKFKNDPYFKFAPYNETRFVHCARISIFRPEYIIHNGYSLEMNDKIKEDLLNILPDIWQNILDAVIDASGDHSPEFVSTIKSLPIPDYMNIQFPNKNFIKERWSKYD